MATRPQFMPSTYENEGHKRR
uniref:Uncharacterized protein n=1 Tax=Nymphaea colorata TaxID=210225 RepID=A0A5K1GEL9_9MAGN